MINKVIYIGYQPLTVKIREDFYMKNLLNEDFEVEYWDLTDIYFKNILKDELDEKFIIKIMSFKQLKNYLSKQNIENTLFISNITFEYRVLKLYRLLSKYNCRTSFFARGSTPSFSEDKSMRNFFKTIKKIFQIKLLLLYLGNKYSELLKKFGIVKKYEVVFQAGDAGIYSIGYGSQLESAKSNIVNVNSFDFDKFKEKENSLRVINNKYCVYLDEYLPYHPDFKMFKIKTVDPSNFYKKLNNYFDLIEKKYDVEILIAAHPKANKYKEINPFNNRKIFFNSSAELTKHSEFVIMHCSTSVSFAVLNNKPIISLTSDHLKSVMPNYDCIIKKFSDSLDTYLVNIDNVKNEENFVNDINNVKYNDYKYKYLTSKDSENSLSKEIFLNVLSKL